MATKKTSGSKPGKITKSAPSAKAVAKKAAKKAVSEYKHAVRNKNASAEERPEKPKTADGDTDDTGYSFSKAGE